MQFSAHAKRSLIIVNGLTLSRMITGIFTVVTFYAELFKPYLAWLLLYILISDLLDGFLARRLAVSTRAGAIFDYVVDRFNFYLAINILVHEGVSPLLFLPFLIRDLLYISVQAYIKIPAIRGTKAASFGGTFSTYAYVLVLNYASFRIPALELIIFLGFSISLVNLLLRVFRLRGVLWKEVEADILS